MMKKLFTLLIVPCLFILGMQISTKAQSALTFKKQILLIGTFHFNNPNADAVKTEDFDITTTAAQLELAKITHQIAKFKPDRIFVEWEYNDQERLDSLYQLYLRDEYQAYIDQTYLNKPQYDLYAKNEIFQLAFRAARKTNLKQVDGIDYTLAMPFDTVMNAIKDAGQDQVMSEISNFITTLAEDANHKRRTMNLTSLLLDLNTEASKKKNNSIYIKTLNRAGKLANFAGAYSVSEWYKRNLYMYALFQKKLQSSDQKAVIILGAGHIAIIEKFLKEDDSYEIVKLKDVLNK